MGMTPNQLKRLTWYTTLATIALIVVYVGLQLWNLLS